MAGQRQPRGRRAKKQSGSGKADPALADKQFLGQSVRLEIIGLKKSPPAFEQSLRAFARFAGKKLVERKILPASSRKKLALAFVSSRRMQSLNKKFLGKSLPTDVLSFASFEKDSFGELALCAEKIKSQAKAHNLSVEDETAYLVLHGLLHLLGYRHEEGGRKAKAMYKIQDEIFNQWLSFQKKAGSLRGKA